MKKTLSGFTALLLILNGNVQAQAKTFEILNREVRQGGVIVVRVFPQFQTKAQGSPVCISVKWGGPNQPGKEHSLNNQGYVFVGVDINTEPGSYIIFLVECGRGNRLDWYYDEVKITDAYFPVRVRRPFIPSLRRLREQKNIKQAFDHGDYSEKYFEGDFVTPLDTVSIDQDRTVGEESSPFGRGHNGIDLITLDTRTGKHNRSVKAINSGKVIMLARNYSTEGNMVIIDHGSGIFSVYMHLSEFLVDKTGVMVQKGEVVAISGNTGNARKGGPHLHCSVKVRNKDGTSDVYVDPFGFMDIMSQYMR